jgi:hypothetical protein
MSDPDPTHGNPLPPPLPPGHPPTPPPPGHHPPSVFSILSSVVAVVAAAFGIYRGLQQFSIPGNDFAIMTAPAYGFFGVAGGAVLGIGMSLIAISRGEPLGQRSLILLPVILGSLVALGAGLWFFGIF